MKQNSTLEYTIEQPQTVSIPQSDMASIRYMFKEMNQMYLEHKPAAYYYNAKRFVDIALSVVFIGLIMSWLTPLLAILIKLSSRGPVFFIQKRTGLHGSEFNCFKFRTMYVNDEADVRQGFLSITSPLARSLISKKEKDGVEVTTPNGSKAYVIQKVQYI